MQRIHTCALICLAILFVLSATASAGQPTDAKRKLTDKNIEMLLKKMSVEEKIGQMTQVTIDVVSAGDDGRREPHALDRTKLEHAIVDYHVGSIINVGPQFYSLSHWVDVITSIQDVATKKTRLGIPILYGIDAIHGATYTEGSTLFPQNIGVAATWDPDLAHRIGEITAREVRASGIPWNFAPVLDLGRQPLWPRLWETYGEDVTLATTMGLSYVTGMMGDEMSALDRIAPCVKHYAGYSFPITGKDRTAAWIDERMMREYFLPPFEAAVRAGVPTVMVNSAEINGIPGHSNYHLLTEILKQEWKFEGFVISDWGDIERLYTRDHVASSPKEAVRMAVMAGVDMSMVPLDFSFYDLLLQLVREKVVPMERIDDAVRRILRVKYLVGLFERVYPDPTLKEEFATAANAAFNRKVAQESITLLKNAGNILPLQKTMKVLVTGPTANMLSVLNSGWTITWQGNEESLYPKDKPTILKAIRAKVGEKNAVYVPGTSFAAPIDIPAAVAAAETSTVVVACLGEPAYCETLGNIDDLTLDEAQLNLIDELARTGKPIVLVLAEGRPRIIHKIVAKAAGIVMAYLPGIEGGSAIADILFGDAIPCGKLPVTYPKYPNALVTYDCKVADLAEGNTYSPEFPFGFGLSYTTFAYSDLALRKDVVGLADTIAASVVVKNTGSVAGDEVVQLYLTDQYRSISPPGRQLKAFKKVALKPGESTTVGFALSANDLSFINRENKRAVEKGKFTVTVDRLQREFELR